MILCVRNLGWYQMGVNFASLLCGYSSLPLSGGLQLEWLITAPGGPIFQQVSISFLAR